VRCGAACPTDDWQGARDSELDDWCRLAGKQRRIVTRAISGHVTDHIFRRYDITSDDDLRQAMERTTDYLDTVSTTPKVEPLGRVSDEPHRFLAAAATRSHTAAPGQGDKGDRRTRRGPLRAPPVYSSSPSATMSASSWRP
jgi:hypothetical protein